MTSLGEIDSHFVKCLGYLHASSKLRKGDPVPLQYILEEAIKNKYGIVKNYTDLVQSCLKAREEEFTPIMTFEESKGSNSDNELELDLLKEDLMCIICNGMDVGARNRLLECSDCHSLYHQECHKPGVTEDSFENWVCFNCKESKKLKLMNGSSNPVVINSSVSSKNSSKSSSSSHRHSSSGSSGGSYKSPSYSKSNDKYKSSSSSKTMSSSSSSSSSNSKMSSGSSSGSNCNSSGSSSNRTSVPPNINIISADKRIQIMKKKAATKLQEKRKLPR